MKMVILVGLPGSGKSTYAKDQNGFEVINQDLLGNRQKCINKTKELLKQGKSVIIDRTNINRKQRNHWLEIAKEFEIPVLCIIFKISPELAKERVENRKNHPTIKEGTSKEKIDEIITMFEKSYEEPELSEGFHSITTYIPPRIFQDNKDT